MATTSLDEETSKNVLRQVEFYFSDSNLPRDKFLTNSINESEDGLVSLALICSFTRMRNHLGLGSVKPDEVPEETVAAVADTLRKSSSLKVSEDVFVITATNVIAQISNIPMLSGTNFKVWKDTLEIVLGCMDLDLALRAEQPTSTPENLNEVKIEKWERSNRMCLMIMKRSISEAFRGYITESKSAKKYLEEIEQYFAKNEKSEASTLLAKLISMKYKGKENIREYIMEMSHLASKLKSFKMELSEDLLVHLVLISLPAHFGQFKVSYNTRRDKWSLSELISHCVQEEERQQRDKTESAHLASTSQNKKKKKGKDVAEGSYQNKKQKKQDEEFTCYFCKKPGHMKKECPKYATWRVKKGLPVEPTAK